MIYYIVIVGYYKTCLQHSGPCHTPERPESFEVMSAYEMHPVFGYTCNSKLHTKKYIYLDLDIQKHGAGEVEWGGPFRSTVLGQTHPDLRLLQVVFLE